MFIETLKETTRYKRKTKFGKYASYNRTKTITKWKCDNCESVFTKNKRYVQGKSEIAFCNKCLSTYGINKLAGKIGYQSRIKNIYEPQIGQIEIDKQGYPYIYIGKNYPYRTGGYAHIREHQYVMEMHLKRRLKRGEIVHHIDGNKRNNELSNLYLTTVKEHNKLHACSESIVFELVKRGMVNFNRKEGRYELSESFNV